MFESFNSFLLSRFSQNVRPGQDIESLLRRYQILSIIYINIFIASLLVLWNFLGWIGLPIPYMESNFSILPLLMLSLRFLKRGHHNLAASSILGYYHLTTLVLSRFSNASLTGLTVTIACPPTAFMLTSSKKVNFINFGCCILQYIGLTFDIRRAFRVTFTEEQSTQIIQVQMHALLIIILLGAISFFQKQIETNLWQLAYSNFERAEKINKEVLQAVEAKDRFISSLSHEIRNPLNAIKGSINYLLGVVRDNSHLQILKHANLSSEILLNLLNNVLDAAKLRSDKMELVYAEASLIDILKKAIIVHSQRLREKEINVRIYLDKTVPSTLWTDSSRLLQIIMNLVSNALKFTAVRGKLYIYVSWFKRSDGPVIRETLLAPIEEMSYTRPRSEVGSRYFEDAKENSPLISSYRLPKSQRVSFTEEFNQVETECRINNITKRTFGTTFLRQIDFKNTELTKRYNIWDINGTSPSESQLFKENSLLDLATTRNHIKQNGYLKVQVSDTGSGIDEQSIPNLFEMFSQCSGNVSSVYGGGGLGLWICKQLCLKMGGDITLYTQLNRGTSFVFSLPINNEDLVDPLVQQKLDNCFPVQGNVRALVVDDYAYNRDIHRLLLEKEGVEVTVACNGKEALDKYVTQTENYYNFIFMDIQMPEMDGFTAAKKIRDWEESMMWKPIAIYFVTGEYYNEEEINEELKARGQKDSAPEVKCLKKPIDVEMIKKIVAKARK